MNFLEQTGVLISSQFDNPLFSEAAIVTISESHLDFRIRNPSPNLISLLKKTPIIVAVIISEVSIH